MAFTKNGISYIGTDGRDSLVLTAGVGDWAFPTGGPAYIEARADDDQVTFNGNAANVTLFGGQGNDTTFLNAGGVTGQLASSTIELDDGDDTATWGNITNTTLQGGAGNDNLFTNPAAGAGLTTNASWINGNGGNDTITIAGSITFTSVWGGQGADTIFFTPGPINAFDNVVGGNKGNDNIFVDIQGINSANNEIYGGQNNDLLDGTISTADLFLSGDLGFDTLIGAFGADILEGGDDADILNGGANSDTLTGGSSADRFNFANFNTADTVTDFVSGAIGGGLSDRLALDVTSGTTATNGVGALALLQRTGMGGLAITAVANVPSNSQMAYTRTVAMGTSIRNPLFNGANLAAIRGQITGLGVAVTATAANVGTMFNNGFAAPVTVNQMFTLAGDMYTFLGGNQVRRIDNGVTMTAMTTVNSGGFFALGRSSVGGNLYKLEGTVTAMMATASVSMITNIGTFLFVGTTGMGTMWNYVFNFAAASATAMASIAVSLTGGRTRTIAQVDGAFMGSDIFLF